MRERTHYTEGFRQQALEKVYTRGQRTVKAVAAELNMNPWTLKNWMKTPTKPPITKAAKQAKRPADWSTTERLQGLLDSHGLDETALSVWCREQGLFRHHLQQWREAFEAGAPAAATADRTELRALQATNTTLARELRRKDKALAEAAALLVLQKKFQALWVEEDA